MQVSAIQTRCRLVSGNKGQFIEDVHAALNVMNVPPGQIGERIVRFTGQSTASAAWRDLWLNLDTLFPLPDTRLIPDEWDVPLSATPNE